MLIISIWFEIDLARGSSSLCALMGGSSEAEGGGREGFSEVGQW